MSDAVLDALFGYARRQLIEAGRLRAQAAAQRRRVRRLGRQLRAVAA